MLVAFANTVVCAILIASEQHHPSAGFALMVVVMGFLPAMITGAIVGHLAQALGHVNRIAVGLGMAMLAVLAVSSIADMFSAGEFVVMASVPTIVACIVLERWTRPKPRNHSQNLPEYVA